MNKRFLVSLALTALAFAGGAQAESNFQTGTGALTSTARLDFKITVAKMLYLRVGTAPAGYTTGTTVDLIDFTVPAANNGDSSVIAASAGSGDLGNGAVTARVVANGGNVSFTSTTAGALTNATSDTISFGKIGVASAALTSATTLPHPTFVDGAASTPVTLTAVSKVVNQDAKWTFTYLNNAVVAAGTYGGVNTQNGRVTYTASLP